MDLLEEAQKICSNAKTPAALTGAGISAESGVPTFRGEKGLWKNYKPEDLATFEAFSMDPGLVWNWYEWRRGLISKCKPNKGHLALAKYEKEKINSGKEFNLITQNVDGLHSKSENKKVIEIHGSIWKLRCMACYNEREDRTFPLPQLPPHCKKCGSMERPAVVWFGESLDREVMDRTHEILNTCDLLLVIGTSAVVYPAASFAGFVKQRGAKVIVVNPMDTPIDGLADILIQAAAGEALAKIL